MALVDMICGWLLCCLTYLAAFVALVPASGVPLHEDDQCFKWIIAFFTCG